jgi:membrane protease YdiL (CAAX protease family)
MNERTLELAETVLAWLSAVLLALGVWYFRPGTRRWPLPPQRRRAVPWNAGEVLVAFGVYRWLWPALVVQVLVSTGLLGWFYGPGFLESIKAQDGADQELNLTRLQLWAQTAAFPFQLASIPVLFYLVSGTQPYQLGLTLRRAGKNILAGVLAWISLTPFVFTLNWLVTWSYQKLLHGVPEEHPLTRLGQQSLESVDWVLLVFSAVVAAPVLEELFFRGVVQPWLRRYPGGGAIGIAAALIIAVADRIDPIGLGWKQSGVVGVLHGLTPVLFVLLMVPPFLLLRHLRNPRAAGAIYGSALFFAAAHSFAWPTPVPLFVLGLGLGYLAYRTQSLVTSIAVHALFNSVACVMLLLPHMVGPVPEPEKGNDTTAAARLPVAVSTSTAVPGSWLPRRMYASAIVPRRGDTTDEVTCPTSLPSRNTRAPAGGGPSPCTFNPSSVRLTWPRSRAMTIGSCPR